MPGVARVHDLHVWAMGTSDTALTAHLVMPQGQADDAFLQQASDTLQQRFGIGHVTLQVVRSPFMKGCAETVASGLSRSALTYACRRRLSG